MTPCSRLPGQTCKQGMMCGRNCQLEKPGSVQHRLAGSACASKGGLQAYSHHTPLALRGLWASSCMRGWTQVLQQDTVKHTSQMRCACTGACQYVSIRTGVMPEPTMYESHPPPTNNKRSAFYFILLQVQQYSPPSALTWAVPATPAMPSGGQQPHPDCSRDQQEPQPGRSDP